ncbi:MAG TPA: Cof-type HAD-IIB family hydrolase [Acidimicrobiales bacterium]|nr:Cof-type HAD-IIB family hydrolase [Acidimicrobiales bacterium]
MTVRLIASDIDGTLLRDDGTMSDRTVAALAAAEDAGIVVVLCTGRPPRWMHPIAETTGHRGLAICANGAIVYDLHTETVVEHFPIDVEVGRRLAVALKTALPDAQMAVERVDGMWREPSYVPIAPTGHTEAAFEDLLTEPMVKLIAKHPGMTSAELHAAAHDAVAELADLAETTYSSGSIIEISAAGVTKAFGLEHLATERGIDAADVVAFGDMPNDIPMLSWAGRGVAVGNAHPDVVAIADDVCASNEDDGVAQVIEELLATRSR